MRELFKTRKREVACGLLVIAIMAALWYVATRSIAHRRAKSIAARVQLDPDALGAIDHSRLEKPLREFIELLETPNEVIGQKMTTFSSLFDVSLKRMDLSSVDQYDFLLPITSETGQWLKPGEVTCWPKMIVEVDPKSQSIRRVVVYMQCL